MKKVENRKDKIKLIRGIVQGALLLILFILLLNTFFNFKKYTPYATEAPIEKEDKGFIALSYFAVDREGNEHMMSTERLDEHLAALKLNGYQTISQADIKDYYHKNQPLTDKSLFLFFEDGRRDTAIFSTPLLEKYNYLGTILNYADKFEGKDPKFLNPKDIKRLEDGTFWEVGSNGYRLAYINVFDRYAHYLGELDSDEFVRLREFIGRDYNHYLMDFIRDEQRLPKENADEMKRRVQKDYERMEEIYQEELGEMPMMYALMHSNTGQFATNDRVSGVNEAQIREKFVMNFNREGYSFNDQEASIYDLTRMQPQPYWYPNHLLMRIQDDTDEEITFVEGEAKVRADWDELSGASEFKENALILTTEPKGKAQIRLKEEWAENDFTLSTRLTGNVLGSQKIYLLSDEDLSEYLAIELKNNILSIADDGAEIFSVDLDEHDEIEFPSIDEDEFAALEKAYKLYEKNRKKRKQPTKMEKQLPVDEEPELQSVEDGGEAYVEELQINELGERELMVTVRGNSLSVWLDEKEVVRDLEFSKKHSGYLQLEAGWEEYGYSQRNLADDVYDGVFEDLLVQDLEEEDIYRNKLEGRALAQEKLASKWRQVINWFIKNL